MIIMRRREDDIVDETPGFPEQGLGVVADKSHSPVAFVCLPSETLRTGFWKLLLCWGRNPSNYMRINI